MRGRLAGWWVVVGLAALSAVACVDKEGPGGSYGAGGGWDTGRSSGGGGGGSGGGNTDNNGAASSDGEALYMSWCASCHGADGRGTTAGPGIRGDADDPGELRDVIRHGEGTMPAYKDTLSSGEINAIVDYIVVRWG